VSSFFAKKSKLLQAPRLAATSATVKTRAKRVQPAGSGSVIML
jgi:hypothetical protein